MTELLNLCQDGTNVTVRAGTMLKIILPWNKCVAFNVMTSNLIGMTYRTSLIEHPPYPTYY